MKRTTSGARRCAALLLVFAIVSWSALALAAIDGGNGDGKCDDLLNSVSELKGQIAVLAQPKDDHTVEGGVLGIVGALAGGLLAAAASLRSARAMADAAAQVEREKFIKDKRFAAYLDLFRKFEPYPQRRPEAAIDSALVAPLRDALGHWYWTAGGLVMSSHAQATFTDVLWALGKLQAITPDHQNRRRFYAVIFLLTSRVRTELLRDIEGRQIPGHRAVSADTDQALDAFRVWLKSAHQGDLSAEAIVQHKELQLAGTDDREWLDS